MITVPRHANSIAGAL